MNAIGDFAPDGGAMPRFDDGMVNMQELIRTVAEALVNEIMSAQADELCDSSQNTRNGHRERRLITCAGAITMRIPELRIGSYFPDELIERYSRADRAVASAIAETCASESRRGRRGASPRSSASTR
ncbi:MULTISPECIES: transposase [unclassified Adlercreutzia]|uniref:transposase n=1 Tax=unclassified Adlercreutzia TaxID=2636013 RepID=UPI0021070C3A|nr:MULTISPECIES: transposase [unclassified Adlercreutzia]